MHLLALDIGKKHTGVAFADSDAGYIIALETIHHKTTDDLIIALRPVIEAKKVNELVIGLPRLPGGEEGEQAVFVRDTVKEITKDVPLPVTFVDERYTSTGRGGDPDARAACSILAAELSRRNKS